jgi:hypothetical protein
VHRDVPPPSFTINRTDIIRNRVQQAIRPEAVSVFGAIAALAMLVLVRVRAGIRYAGRSGPLGAARFHRGRYRGGDRGGI